MPHNADYVVQRKIEELVRGEELENDIKNNKNRWRVRNC